MTWRPVTTVHAIERVRFVVKFKERIPGKLSRHLSSMIEKTKLETRLEGPAPTNAINFDFQVGPDGQTLVVPATKVQGWQFVRKNSAGIPLEVVVVDGDQISYETAEYRRWTIFRQRFTKVAADAIAHAAISLDVDHASLEYYDRFIFNGPPDAAAPEGLLSDVAPFLHKDALSGRTMWHLHRGWFEGSKFGDVLVNQNLDATDVVFPDSSGPSRTIGIMTKAEVRAASYPVEDHLRSNLLDFLHEITKFYFTQAMQPKILPMVGIDQEKQ